MARTIKGIVDSTSYSWLTYYIHMQETAQIFCVENCKCKLDTCTVEIS